MKIGLLGIGTIGTGVREHLAGRDDISIKRILVRRDHPELGALATFHYEDILFDPEIDTVVELMGGMQPAFDYVLSALKAGKNVVTANKLMLSYHFEELLAAAQQSGVLLKIDASVGGGIPYLFNLMRSGRADTIHSLFGIVNGTTNLILDTMQLNGSEFSDVLAQAQRAGYAEADPSADIDGIDARSKLCISASIAFRRFVRPDDIAVSGIRNITREDIQVFKKLGYVCRLLVRAERIDADHICAFVEPTLLNPSEPEATVHRNDNLIGLVGEYVGQQYFFGQGAGKDPTAFAVVLGLTDIAHGVAAHIDVGVVHTGQTKVGVDPVPKVDMMTAPVGIERRLNIAVFSDFREHLPQELRPLFLLQGPGGVVVIEPFQAEKLLFQDGAIIGPVELPVVLQFPLIHGIFLSDARYYRDNRTYIWA